MHNTTIDQGSGAAPVTAPAKKNHKKQSKTASRHPKATARPGSKKAAVLRLLRKPQGATLPELTKATGWQAHSVRGFISGSLGKSMRLQVNALKRADGQRAYHLNS